MRPIAGWNYLNELQRKTPFSISRNLRKVTPKLADALDIRADAMEGRVCFPVRDFAGRLRGLHGRAVHADTEQRDRHVGLAATGFLEHLAERRQHRERVAAASASSFAPRPMNRADSIAAASVTRIISSASSCSMSSNLAGGAVRAAQAARGKARSSTRASALRRA